MNGKLTLRPPSTVAIITNNTCNLTCNNCGTLQNYNFNDVSNWAQNEKYIRKWAEIAHFDDIDLLGGEPFLNPELYTWAKNVKGLFPNTTVKVSTNGTLLNLDKNIFLSRKIVDLGVAIIVSTHTAEDYELHREWIHKIAEPFINDLKIERIFTPSEDIIHDTVQEIYKWKDSGALVFSHVLVDRMYPNYILEVKDNTVILDDGDPIKSHEKCIFNVNCMAIQEGLFYKCPSVTNYAIMKNLVNYEDRAYPILDSYKACSPFQPIEEIKEFFESLYEPIDACRLCAFDKKINPTTMERPVTFDKSYKKAFKGATKL